MILFDSYNVGGIEFEPTAGQEIIDCLFDHFQHEASERL
jgi:hypothetical protein